MKSLRYPLILLGIAFLLVVIGESTKEEEIDWTDNFSSYDKTPYATWILYDRLNDIFPDREIERVDVTIYERFTDDSYDWPDPSSIYFLINDRFSLSEVDTRELLAFARRGGTVFIAAEDFGPTLSDSLDLETEYSGFDTPFAEDGQVVNVRLASPSYGEERTFEIPTRTRLYYFSRFSQEGSTVLETLETGDPEIPSQPTAIRIPLESGEIILSTLPRLLTNYTLLSDQGDEHGEKLLSALPVAPVIWDEHYKPESVTLPRRQAENMSVMRYIISRPALRLAWYALVIGLLLFCILGIRRRQRIIPILEPPRNTSLEFVRTIGRLYFQNGNYGNIASKQIDHLLDYIRTRLNLPTSQLDSDLAQRVADRSGVEVPRVNQMFQLVRRVTSSFEKDVSERDLLQLNSEIEYFYRNSKR